MGKRFPGKEDIASLTYKQRGNLRRSIRTERANALADSLPAAPALQRTTSNTSLFSAPAPLQVSSRDEAALRAFQPPTIEQLAPPPANENRFFPASLRSSSSAVISDISPQFDRCDEDAAFMATIDPAILDDETLASIEVADADVDRLRTIILPPSSADTADMAEEGEPEDLTADLMGIPSIAGTEDDMDEETARLVLGHQKAGDDASSPAGASLQTAKSVHQWIDSYAQFNVVRSIGFARTWLKLQNQKAKSTSKPEELSLYSMRGNSRNEPSPYVFFCRRTEGCKYFHFLVKSIESHEASCTKAMVERRNKEIRAATLRCSHPGCDFETAAANGLQQHQRTAHQYIPKACDTPQCDPNKIYTSTQAWTYHRLTVHSCWPSPCVFPGCSSTIQFTTTSNLVAHLIKHHELSTAEARLPYLPARAPKRLWIKQNCIVPECQSQMVMTRKSGYLVHLTGYHKMTAEDSERFIEQEAGRLWETYVPQRKVLKSNAAIPNRTHLKRHWVPTADQENEKDQENENEDERRNGGGPAKAKKPRSGGTLPQRGDCSRNARSK